MNSTNEFLLALSQLQPLVQEPIEYRIHYDSTGNIIMCTMQQHPTDTTYIVVSKYEYDNYFRYTVVDNKLKLIEMNPEQHVQLKKSTTGYKVVKNHAGLIVEPGETYDDVEYYERTN